MSYTKIIQSGNTLDVYEYEKSPIGSVGSRARKVNSGDKRLGALLAGRRGDNLYRSQRALVRLIKSNLVSGSPPSFVTLTTTGTLDTCFVWPAFRQFYRRLKKCFGKGLKYVAVIEYQRKSGNPHVHALIWGLPTYVIKNERHHRTIQRLWQMGFVDCITTNGSPALAHYLSKYLSKGLSDKRLLQKRAYSTSRNVLRPLLYTSNEDFSYLSSYFLKKTHQLTYQRIYPTDWLGQGHFRSYSSD